MTIAYHPPAWMGPDVIPSVELGVQVKAAAAAFQPIKDAALAYIAEHRAAFQANHAWTAGIDVRPDEHFDVCNAMTCSRL